MFGANFAMYVTIITIVRLGIDPKDGTAREIIKKKAPPKQS